MEISHLSHQHKLGLKSVNHPYYCPGCNQLGIGPTYTCDIDDCNFFLHKQCGEPQLRVKYPFSTKCVLEFCNEGSGQGCLCDVCGKKIKGNHYRCSCNFKKRNVHPFCLSHEPTLVAAAGLTLNLKKVAAAKCLHCKTLTIKSSKVSGWAYVSSCETYCYHVACVMKIINSKWRNDVTENFDPNQIIKKEFPADMDNMQLDVDGDGKSKSMSMKALSVVFRVMCALSQ